MKTADIREKFLSYFEAQGHTRVSSSSLVPEKDPTLLFANAGMNQFKDCFLGFEKRAYTRATSAQKCVRAGGKHNDLENVGFTARHHTFFEMMGNFSFGDYFKKDAIHYAWEFTTKTLGLPKDRLRVSVYTTDDEAAEIWHKQEGVPLDRIVRFEEDNFWAMGDTGPCGPCSEIFWDQGKEVDGDRWLEFWNCVFMQYDRSADGKLNPLPKPAVDTGMGLERMAAIMQGKPTNYDIDILAELLNQTVSKINAKTKQKLVYVPGDSSWQSSALKVIADHLRSTSFLIADGVLPSNEGRGYVLRRILRRAVRFSKRLGMSEPLLADLLPTLISQMGATYPELEQRKNTIQEILKEEEAKFFETLERGLHLLEEAFGKMNSTHSQGKTLPADVVFKLYDTYGFPVDLTGLIARERGLSIDEGGFEKLMTKQQERSRKSWKGSGDQSLLGQVKEWKSQGFTTKFTGYSNEHELQSEVLAVTAGASGAWLALSPTPFYAEGGGQAAETGVVELMSGEKLQVVDSQKIFDGGQAIFVEGAAASKIKKGDKLKSFVNLEHRRDSRSNHTATHLLHAALRKVLGTHVEQAGSLVEPGRLRFDFSHNKALSSDEIQTIEAMVNAEISKNIKVNAETCSYDDAIKKGALAFFSEKYGDQVRVIQVPGFSTELCGGIHVNQTGDILTFKILSESAVASGTRRIEAVTGRPAMEWYKTQQASLSRIADVLKVPALQAEERVEKILKEQKELQKEIEVLKKKLASGGSSSSKTGKTNYKNTPVVVYEFDASEGDLLRDRADACRKENAAAIHVLLCGELLLITLDNQKLPQHHAGNLLKELAPKLGGRGGGQAQTAQGKVDKAQSNLATVVTALESLL